MGMELEPEADEPAPPGDRHDSRDPRTGNRGHRHVEHEAPDEDSYPLGNDGLPLPTLWARRHGDTLIATCAACGGEHEYPIPLGAPPGAADGYTAAPCRDIESIGGAYVREWRPGEPIDGTAHDDE